MGQGSTLYSFLLSHEPQEEEQLVHCAKSSLTVCVAFFSCSGGDLDGWAVFFQDVDATYILIK